jgi:deoxyribose-phosphate aldolase
MNKTDEEWASEITTFFQQADTLAQADKPALDKKDLDSLKADPKSIASYIDHTVLKLDATGTEIDKLCEEAQTFGFAVGIPMFSTI